MPVVETVKMEMKAFREIWVDMTWIMHNQERGHYDHTCV